MAVYKRTYRPYDGELTPSWSRLLVIPRYAFEDLRRSRFLSLFYVGTFIYPVIAALIIYVQHNASALRLLNVENASRLISINSTFFLTLLGWQSMVALTLAAFVGPSQISPDLTNNALSLYLARPFSRLEYVMGKMVVLVTLISLMTWVPGLLLFTLQSYLEGWSWAAANARIAFGMFVGAWIWILLLTVLSLALSAWVKWKPAAGALLFVVYFVAAALGTTINSVQRTNWGSLLNIGYLVGSIWGWLFEGANRTSNGAVFFRAPVAQQLPLWTCWGMLLALLAICVWMLASRIRGAEVVR